MYYFPPHLKNTAALPGPVLKGSNLSQIWKEMKHKISREPVTFPHLSERKIKPRVKFSLPALSFMRGVQTVKIIKSNSSVCCTFGIEWTRASLTMH